MTGDYEQGFATGEREAWNERVHGKVIELPRNIYTEKRVSEWMRGFADGYTPRSAIWHRAAPARAFSGHCAGGNS